MPASLARRLATDKKVQRAFVSGRGRGRTRTRANPGRGGRGGPTYGMVTRVKKANAPMSRGTQMSFTAPRSTRITHTEWFDTLTNVQPVYTYTINPGISDILPWLSRIALSFERYRIVSLVFEWVPSCPSTTAGSLTFAFDFDSHDADPTEIQLMSFVPRKTTNLWMPMSFPVSAVDCNRTPWHFTRNGSVLQNEDIKTLDVGKFIVFADGTDPPGQAPPESGKIFVHYVVDFLNPTYEELGVIDIDMAAQMVQNPQLSDGTQALPCRALGLKNMLPYLEAVTPNHNCMVYNNGVGTYRENAMLYKCIRDFEGQLSCVLPSPIEAYQGRTNFYEKVGAWITKDPSYVTTNVAEDATSTEFSMQPASHGTSFVKQLLMKAGWFLIFTSLRATATQSGVQPSNVAAGNILMRLILGQFPKSQENFGATLRSQVVNRNILPPTAQPASNSTSTTTTPTSSSTTSSPQPLDMSTISVPKSDKEKILRSLKQ